MFFAVRDSYSRGEPLNEVRFGFANDMAIVDSTFLIRKQTVRLWVEDLVRYLLCLQQLDACRIFIRTDHSFGFLSV